MKTETNEELGQVQTHLRNELKVVNETLKPISNHIQKVIKCHNDVFYSLHNKIKEYLVANEEKLLQLYKNKFYVNVIYWDQEYKTDFKENEYTDFSKAMEKFDRKKKFYNDKKLSFRITLEYCNSDGQYLLMESFKNIIDNPL